MRLIALGGREFGEAGRPHIVGVVNLSPESPNQDSVATSADGAVALARCLGERSRDRVGVEA